MSHPFGALTRRARPAWPALLAGAAASLIAASLVMAPSASGHGRPAVRARGHVFVPATGNWDGSAPGGFAASFDLAYTPGNTIFGSPYSYGDLVTFSPSVLPSPTGCLIDPGSTGYAVAGEGALFPLTRAAGFGLAKTDLYGGLVGGTSAVLTQREIWPPEPEFAQCPKGITWTFHPARRRPVHDGTWTVHLRGAEIQTVKILAGGRVLNSIAIPNVGECGGGIGGVTVFITADGVASFGNPSTAMRVNITFTTPTSATGEVSESTASCGVEVFPLSATLTKAAR